MVTNNSINYLPGFIPLNQQVASTSAALNFTTGITSAYNNYFLLISALVVSATTTIQVQISTNGGVSYIATGYLCGNNTALSSSTSFTNTTTTTGIFLSSSPGSSGIFFNYGINLNNLTSGAGIVAAFATGNRFAGNLTTTNMDLSVGVYSTAATTVNAIRIIPGSGTLTSGSATLFGVLK
jgi:hypothetical protein